MSLIRQLHAEVLAQLPADLSSSPGVLITNKLIDRLVNELGHPRSLAIEIVFGMTIEVNDPDEIDPAVDYLFDMWVTACRLLEVVVQDTTLTPDAQRRLHLELAKGIDIKT